MKTSLVALVLFTSATAFAQTPPSPTPTPAPAPGGAPQPGDASQPAPPAPPASPDDDKKAQAKALYEEGLGHYNLGDFDKAVEAFKKAYAISNAPGLLFNIAQSYRLKKDYEQASYFYTTYLRLKPEATNRQDVEDRLAEMQKMIEEQKKLQNSAPVGVISPDEHAKDQGPAITTTEPKPEGGIAPKTLMVSGIAAGGAGAALILTGVIFGSLAKSNQSDIEGLQASGGVWTQEFQDKYDAGKRDNTIAIITYIVGGAALATGGTMYVLGYLKKKRTTVALNPTPGGKTLAVGWSF